MREGSLASQSPTESYFDHRKGRPDTRHPPAAHAAPVPNGRPPARSPSTARSAINGVVPGDGHSSARTNETHAGLTALKETERQLPPHLQRSQDVHPHRAEPPSAEPQDKPRSPTESRHYQNTDRHASAPDHKGPVNEAYSETGQVAPTDDEALRKAYISDRVEKARLRRQQEEEERAKASERARKKAEELAKRFEKPADVKKPDDPELKASVNIPDAQTSQSQPTEV